MDVYYPPDSMNGARLPAVVFVSGYSDQGVQAVIGCRSKEMECYISWGRLAAASGLVAVAYTCLEPVGDLHTLFRYLLDNAAALRIDESRIGLWACSGNVPMALSLLMKEDAKNLKCAVLCYGFTLDFEGATWVSDASRQWGFANPCAGKSMDEISREVPLFVMRAGRDEIPHLNEAMDSFLSRALASNLPLTLANHPEAPHAFDLMHDSDLSREIIRQLLRFMQFHLLGNAGGR